jgi:hypothetical protein
MGGNQVTGLSNSSMAELAGIRRVQTLLAGRAMAAT